MLVSSLAQAVLSGACVGAVTATLRRSDARSGGLAAAIPINSLPALYWLFVEHGRSDAGAAALAALWGTGLTVLAGLAFAWLALALRIRVAALLALGSAAALGTLISAMPVALGTATALALLAVVAGQVAQPHTAENVPPPSERRNEIALSMLVAGAMSLFVCELAALGAPQLGGLLATFPVIGIAALCGAYRQGGKPRMLRVLEGYLSGMFAKAAFLGALALAWSGGWNGLAWLLAFATAALALVAQHRVRQTRIHLFRRTT